MSNHGSSTVPLYFLFAVAILWLAIASVQVGANALQRDLYGVANGEFLAGYPNDRDTRETEAFDGQDQDRAPVARSRERNANDPSPVASKSFRYYPYAKRNIDEIDRTAFDNFFKRNPNAMDRDDWNEFVDRLANYLTRRTSS